MTNNPETEQALVTVTQEDRSRAADLARKVYGHRIANDIADGTIEHHHFLEAFARHREQAQRGGGGEGS